MNNRLLLVAALALGACASTETPGTVNATAPATPAAVDADGPTGKVADTDEHYAPDPTDVRDIEVPNDVLDAFRVVYPDALVESWNKAPGLYNNRYEARFDVAGVPYVATFERDGRWLHTRTPLDVGRLPAGVAQRLRADGADPSVMRYALLKTPRYAEIIAAYPDGEGDLRYFLPVGEPVPAELIERE